MRMIGLHEALIIGGVVVLIFGATRIPKIGRSLGEGLTEFKKAVREAKEVDQEQGTPRQVEESKSDDSDAQSTADK
jgi:sec-independent protein translocase protein TatA